MMAKRYVLTRIPARRLVYQGGPTSYRPAQDFRFRRALRPAYRMPGRVGSFLPPGPGAGVGVILEPNPATPSGQDVLDAIANWRD